MRRATSLVVVAVLTLLGAGAAEPTRATTTAARAATVGSPSGGDPYYPADGNGGYQVTHYAIRDTYDPGTDALRGTTQLRAKATQDLSAFYLDLVLKADRVLVDGVPAEFTKPTKHSLRVTPDHALTSGQPFTVRVSYHGRPGSISTKVDSPGWDLWFHRRGETIAEGEPQNGPWWFAANEIPTDKATYDITVRVPAGREAVSNGELVSTSTVGPTTSWHWRMSQPMVTYLAFFAAGDFALRSGVADGHPYVYAVSKRLGAKQRSAQFTRLRRTAPIVRWESQQFGDYPFTSMGGLVAGFSLPYALETQTRPVYDSFTSSRIFMVHELAHQWFGDDVTLSQWPETWLNEGFATYVEWLYREDHGGATTAHRLRTLYDDPSLRWSYPLDAPGRAHIWDTSVYQRGAMALAALRNRIGDANFTQLLREWVIDHAGANVTSQDLHDLAESVSGQDLDGFFDAWVTSNGRPADTAANGLG
jgi:aminopeptidase N